MKRFAPAAERNKHAIAEALGPRLPPGGTVLEIASGTGQHAAHLARCFPALGWQPSERDDADLASIEAWRAEAGCANLRSAIALDVLAPGWERTLDERPAAVFNANMIHITPWECCVGLLTGLGRLLPPGCRLFLYGPFRFAGRFTAPSNAAFDASLRAQDATWGVRDTTDVERVAGAHGFAATEQLALPANNHVLVFERARDERTPRP